MTKKKEPKMAHSNPAQDALADEFESLIDHGSEGVDDEELAERERKTSEIVENVRARVSRRERA